ncbi:1239_t:CDS:2 [Acaulospora colombiana]|uniref:1239_t:CDS:1 n=1 Tax=Acaulospora colombiana TaxID=27376 RepID=A0ACA9JZ68_9GLOM|nr:1239_t:CDS:2 [Acaulospora colombiana]
MDDLNNLIWGNSGIDKAKNPKSSSTPLNALRGQSNISSTEKTSILSSNKTLSTSPNQSIFRNQAINPNSSVFNSTASSPNYFVSSIKSSSSSGSSPFNKSPVDSPKIIPTTNNTEAFDNILPFNKKQQNLSLIEQLKLQEQEQRRKEEEENKRYNEHYDQTDFWDSLENKGTRNVKINGNSTASDLRKTPSRQVDLFDDFLMPSNDLKRTESDSSNKMDKLYSQPNISLGNGRKNVVIPDTANKSSVSDDLLDFGIFEQAPKSSHETLEEKVADKVDPFHTTDNISLTGSRDSSIISTQRSVNIHKDHLVAQIVDMGFSAGEAETALAATSNGEDVSSAIDILFQQREVEEQVSRRQKTNRDAHKTPHPNRRRSNTAQAHSPRDDDDYDANDSEPEPRSRGRYPKKSSLGATRSNVYGMSISDGESSDRSSSSSNFYQSKEKLISTASEFGLSALKKASTLYKQSKEKVNKAIEELQKQQGNSDDDFKRPRWMQDQYFQDSDDYYSSEKYGDSTDQLNDTKYSDNKSREKYGKMERFGKFKDAYNDESGEEIGRSDKSPNTFNSISREIRDRLTGKNGLNVYDRYGNLERYVDSDNTSNENVSSIRANEKMKKLEKIQDGYDETSSEDERSPNRNHFAPTSSRSRKPIFNDTSSQRQTPKPPKPVVPPKKTKPDFESTYISPRRHQKNNSSKVARESSPIPATSSKSTPIPRPVIYASSEQLGNLETYKNKGNEVFKLGQFDEAERFYSLAIESLPAKHLQLVILYNNRATAKFKNGDHRGCVVDCSSALELIDDVTRPPPPGVEVNLRAQYAKALLRRASAYESMEKYDDAKNDYQQLVNSDPSNSSKVSDGLRRCQMAMKMNVNGEDSPEKASSKQTPKSTQKNSDFEDLSSTATYNSKSDSRSTFGVPLNEYGFIDPNINIPSTTPIDPNSPAVKELRGQARQQEYEESERLRHKDNVDQKIAQWRLGKETNIRALISSLDMVLWDGLGWKKIGLHELVTPAQVKIRYMKAIGKVHPDKLSTSTTIEQRLVANGVFSALNNAWDAFKAQNNM